MKSIFVRHTWYLSCVNFYTMYKAIFCVPIGKFYTTSGCDCCDKYQVCCQATFSNSFHKLFLIASDLIAIVVRRLQILEKCWGEGSWQRDPLTHSFTLSPNHWQSPTSGSFHRNKTDRGLRWDNLSGVRDKRMTWFVGEIMRDKTRAVIKLIKATDTI